MNLVGEERNVFSNLFDKVPARRAGREGDIAGVVIYLASQAGVCGCCFAKIPEKRINKSLTRHMLMVCRCVLTKVGCCLLTDNNGLWSSSDRVACNGSDMVE